MKHMNKKDSFKTPEGYFDTLKDRLLDAVNSEDSEMPKDDGFAVPDGYFDTFNKRLSKKLSERTPKVVRLYPYKKLLYAVSAAAAVVLVVFALQYQPGETVGFDTLASTDIMDYLSTDAYDLDTFDLVAELEVNDIVINDVLDDNIEEENIIEYLDEEIDDLDDLNFEFDE